MKLKFLIALLFCTWSAFAQNDARDTTSIQIRTGSVASGFYTRAPAHFPTEYNDSTQKKYALIIFLHGLGESGNTPAQLIANSQSGGPCYVIGQGQWPTSTVNPIDGKAYKFIVISPIQQGTSGPSNSGSISAAQLNFILDDLYSRYRIDTTRVYLTGLSAGGQGVVDYAGNVSDPNGGGVIPTRHKIAAIVPMSAEFTGSFAKPIADSIFRNHIGLVPVGSPPDTHGANTLNIGYYINQDSAGYVVQTVFNGTTFNGITYAGGHCCWVTIYAPTYRYLWRGHMDNIYESMLRFQLSTLQVTSAFAGSDQSITLPTSSVSVTGLATPGTGRTISNTTWSQISGPNTATIVSPGNTTTNITGLVQGIYTFQFFTLDNLGGTASDQMTVTVLLNSTPHANAGPDQTIIQPTDSVTLTGTASTVDNGTISSYAWSFVSGPASPAIVSPSSSVTQSGKLSAIGTYTYRLTITDNHSNVNSDTVQITVNPKPGCSGIRRVISLTANDQGKFFQTPAWNPGDTIVMSSHPYRWAYFSFDGAHGSPGCPITIMNDTGQVEMVAGIAMTNSTYIHVTGTGSPNHFYGYYIHSFDSVAGPARGNSLQISDRSRAIEMDHIDEYLRTYAMWLKEEAACPDSLRYPNWHLDSMVIHDIRAKNVNQDGFYIGSTGPNGGRPVSCNGVSVSPIPMRLSNIHLYNLIIDSVGRTGIQMSGADSGNNEINNCTVTNTGYEFNVQQGSGIILGGYTHCYVHDNFVKNTFQTGILSIGAGLSQIENNTVDSSGYLRVFGTDSVVKNVDFKNISVDTRTTHTNTLDPTSPAIPLTFIIRNNKTGVSTAQDHTTLVIRSIGVGDGGYSSDTWGTSNVICNNLKLNGIDTAIWSVIPQITYSRNCALPPPPNVFAGNPQTVSLPNSAITLSGQATPNGGSSITGIFWADTTSLASTIITPNMLTTNVTGLAAGVHIFSLTVTVTGGVSSTSFVTITVIPSPANCNCQLFILPNGRIITVP